MKHGEPQVKLQSSVILGFLFFAPILNYNFTKRTTSLSVDPLIVVLTAAAVVIFWRLKSVLGQRTGLERPPNITTAKPEPTAKIIDLKPNPKPLIDTEII